jgi:hypothetical protein
MNINIKKMNEFMLNPADPISMTIFLTLFILLMALLIKGV